MESASPSTLSSSPFPFVPPPLISSCRSFSSLPPCSSSPSFSACPSSSLSSRLPSRDALPPPSDSSSDSITGRALLLLLPPLPHLLLPHWSVSSSSESDPSSYIMPFPVSITPPSTPSVPSVVAARAAASPPDASMGGGCALAVAGGGVGVELGALRRREIAALDRIRRGVLPRRRRIPGQRKWNSIRRELFVSQVSQVQKHSGEFRVCACLSLMRV